MHVPSFILEVVLTFKSMLFLPLLSRMLAAIASFSSSIRESKAASQPLLRLNAQKEFHIAIFADLHYGEEEDGWGITQDVNTTRVMNEILRFEDPDFVILNGDIITGENTFIWNSTKYLDVVVKPLVEHNVRWSSAYGNHDSQYNLSREALFKEEDKYSLSYTQHSPIGIPGVTNYYLPLYAQEQDCDGTPIAIFWFFDSQGGAEFQAPAGSEKIPNWVEPSIATWFLTEHAKLKKKWGKSLPSLAFVHIPPTAFLTVQNKFLPNVGEESAYFPGLNDDVPLAAEGDGTQDVPFMQALVDTPGLHSVYSGHDHGDAWCANWPSVAGVMHNGNTPHICFCKHTGYGGYGNWNRGSRNLKLRFGKEMDVETWVRMENGNIVQRVSLNDTYGADIYPLQDGENASVEVEMYRIVDDDEPSFQDILS